MVGISYLLPEATVMILKAREPWSILYLMFQFLVEIHSHHENIFPVEHHSVFSCICIMKPSLISLQIKALYANPFLNDVFPYFQD